MSSTPFSPCPLSHCLFLSLFLFVQPILPYPAEAVRILIPVGNRPDVLGAGAAAPTDHPRAGTVPLPRPIAVCLAVGGAVPGLGDGVVSFAAVWVNADRNACEGPKAADNSLRKSGRRTVDTNGF